MATYRLQFNYGFTFAAARAVVDYLHRLGISDLYASPYFKAKKGSLHGYDIVDPNVLNPEIGSEDDYALLAEELRARDMGQLLDIVPNHMCVTSEENRWWWDILENGPSSRYAEFYDIEWRPIKKELAGKVLLPFLGGQYGRVLEAQELTLRFDRGTFSLTYYDNTFPLNTKTYAVVLSSRLEELKGRLPDTDEDLAELLSIITALTHLPSYDERLDERRDELYREKELIKKRLGALAAQSGEIRSYLDETVRLFNGRKGDPASFDLLDDLLSRQPYRLAHWRVATDEINYRRFFDINQIAGVRMESTRVFNETHRLTLKLVGEGRVTGLRVDHPDGLHNPSEYFRWLQQACFLNRAAALPGAARGAAAPAPPLSINNSGGVDAAFKEHALALYEEELRRRPEYKPLYIVGEKILTRGERMPEDWPIFSTTGYVFMNSLNGIFVDIAHAREFDLIYERFTRERKNFADIVYEKKKLIMQAAMSSEVNTLGHHLTSLAERNRHTRDFSLNSLTGALTEVIAFFPVYRTYTNSSEVSETDRRYLEIAVAKAKRKNRAISEYIYDFLKEVLLLRFPEEFDEPQKQEWLYFVTKFQQLTGPVMAKGLEDTAFYVYNRLVSLNEVGGSPDRFGIPLETFHGQNLERIKRWPHALIATSTHDSKRSEDVRARLNVLSEIPAEWRAALARWRRLNKKKKPAVEGRPVPDANEEYLYYQTLIGAWPFGAMDAAAFAAFSGRIKDYMLKAVREGKVNSSWINMSCPYEEALMAFIDATLQTGAEFTNDVAAFQRRIARYGMFNSLSQTLLKITAPGVPDFYQGTELWTLTLVDPDNRGAVDYEQRRGMLGELEEREVRQGRAALAAALLETMEDGRVKLFLTSRALAFRQRQSALFDEGDYSALDTAGERAGHVCAFARQRNGAVALTIAPRFFTRLAPQGDALPLGAAAWGETALLLPFEQDGALYREVFTGAALRARQQNGGAALPLKELLARFPVALLEREGKT